MIMIITIGKDDAYHKDSFDDEDDCHKDDDDDMMMMIMIMSRRREVRVGTWQYSSSFLYFLIRSTLHLSMTLI